MAKRKIKGFCHVCGDYGELSEEHVPPQRAFNDRPYIELSFHKALALGPEGVPDREDGRKRQGGIRFSTLCGNCNNRFGGNYAREFVDWCYKGLFILESTGGGPAAFCATDVYPLRIVKQVIAMFFSVNHDGFRLSEVGKELVWLLLNKEEKGLPDGVKLYTYFNWDGRPRYNSFASLIDIFDGHVTLMTEITHPPFGYVMTIESDSPDPRLFEITDWAWCDFHDQRTVCLRLPVLPTHLNWYSGDYRTVEQINKQARASREVARREGIDPDSI